MLSLSKFSCSSNKLEYVPNVVSLTYVLFCIDSIHCKGIHVTY